MPAQEIVERGSGATVVDDGDLDAGLGFQQLGREIERASGPPARAETELPGIHFGVLDQLRQRLDAETIFHHQDQRSGRHLGDRGEIREIEWIVRMQRLGDQRAGRNKEQRVAVGRRIRELAQGRDEIAAGLVFDEDRRAEIFAHLLRDQTRHDIGRAAGGEPDEDADRPAGKVLTGKVLRLRGLRARCEHRAHEQCQGIAFSGESLPRT